MSADKWCWQMCFGIPRKVKQWWVQQSKNYSLRMWNLFNACIFPSVFILFPHDSLPPVFPIFWMLKPWCLHLSILFAAASPTPGHCLAHHGCTKDFYQKRIAHDIWGERNLGCHSFIRWGLVRLRWNQQAGIPGHLTPGIMMSLPSPTAYC